MPFGALPRAPLAAQLCAAARCCCRPRCFLARPAALARTPTPLQVRRKGPPETAAAPGTHVCRPSDSISADNRQRQAEKQKVLESHAAVIVQTRKACEDRNLKALMDLYPAALATQACARPPLPTASPPPAATCCPLRSRSSKIFGREASHPIRPHTCTF